LDNVFLLRVNQTKFQEGKHSAEINAIYNKIKSGKLSKNEIEQMKKSLETENK
jgi:molecular chaperone DnaK (HSP70)